MNFKQFISFTAGLVFLSVNVSVSAHEADHSKVGYHQRNDNEIYLGHVLDLNGNTISCLIQPLFGKEYSPGKVVLLNTELSLSSDSNGDGFYETRVYMGRADFITCSTHPYLNSVQYRNLSSSQQRELQRVLNNH